MSFLMVLLSIGQTCLYGVLAFHEYNVGDIRMAALNTFASVVWFASVCIWAAFCARRVS